MQFKKYTILTFTMILAVACQSKAKSTKVDHESAIKEIKTDATQQDLSQYEKAYFASGCFWCVEAIFESVKGVQEVVSGYAGGNEKDPTYKQVANGQTSHAESVKVYYNPKVISFTALVQVFFGSHDPTSLNRQGPDRGPQYRSVAFYKNEQEKTIIEAYIGALVDQKIYDEDPITTQVVEFTKFYDAEDYHQDYERKNPNNSYIRNVSIPRLNRFKANFQDFLKEDSH